MSKHFRLRTSGLVTRSFLLWLAVSLLTLLAFDLLWAHEVGYDMFTYLALYINTLVAALLMSMPSAMWRRRWPQVALMVISCAVMEANLMYCRTYRLAIPLECYSMASNMADFGGSIRDALRLADLLMWLPTGVAALVARQLSDRPSGRSRIVYWLVTFICAVASGIMLHLKGGFCKRLDFLSNCVNQAPYIAPVYTIAGVLVYDAIRDDESPSPEEISMARDFVASQPPAPGLTPQYRRNIVLILCESLETWPIGLSVGGVPVTPRLNAIVADTVDNLYIPSVKTQVGPGRSIDAQLMMLNGLLPPKRGVWAMKYYNRRMPSLVKALKHSRDSVQATIATLDLPTTWNQLSVANAQGFDEMLFRDDWDTSIPSSVNVNGKPLDEVLLRQTAGRIAAGKIWNSTDTTVTNFLLMVTMTGHNPFEISAGCADQKLHNDKYPEILNGYIAVTNYLDRCIGDFIDYLKSRPDWPETTVIIAGDHEGLAGHRASLVSDGWLGGAIDSGEHTPFIVVNSPLGGGYLSREIGQVELYATMLDLFGAALPGGWRGVAPSIWSPDVNVDYQTASAVSDIILRADILP